MLCINLNNTGIEGFDSKILLQFFQTFQIVKCLIFEIRNGKHIETRGFEGLRIQISILKFFYRVIGGSEI